MYWCLPRNSGQPIRTAEATYDSLPQPFCCALSWWSDRFQTCQIWIWLDVIFKPSDKRAIYRTTKGGARTLHCWEESAYNSSLIQVQKELLCCSFRIRNILHTGSVKTMCLAFLLYRTETSIIRWRIIRSHYCVLIEPVVVTHCFKSALDRDSITPLNRQSIKKKCLVLIRMIIMKEEAYHFRTQCHRWPAITRKSMRKSAESTTSA